MNVRAIRNKLKYSQVELAKVLGVSSTKVGRIERGKNKPTPAMICKIKELCDKHGIDFVDEQETESFVAWHLSAMYELKY